MLVGQLVRRALSLYRGAQQALGCTVTTGQGIDRLLARHRVVEAKLGTNISAPARDHAQSSPAPSALPMPSRSTPYSTAALLLR